MSDDALYERYKDALRRGHVASLRGNLEDALAAYAEAASIAPERSTPHTSAGTALLRGKRPADALRHYAAALRLSARDDAALLGRAQALADLDRRPEAADAFDALADVRAAADRLADAVDAARRGLELAEGRDRRRTLERLIDRLRESEPGEPGRMALEQALVVLEGQAVLPVMPGQVGATGGQAPSMQGIPAAGSDAGATAVEPSVPVPPIAPAYRRALDRELEAGLDATALALLAEDALDAEDREAALERLLDLAAAYRRDGHIDAALDACYLGLSLDPDDTGIHLALAELYDERGWSALATEKVDLVATLVALDGGADAIGRVAAARSDRG